MPTLKTIEEARARIAGYVKRTPLQPSSSFGKQIGCHIHLKMEVFQKTGSFKVRGAFNKLLSLDAKQKQQKIVAVSGGNHAQAVAYAAMTLALDSLIIMPEGTPQNYLDATRGYGAEVKLVPSTDEAFKLGEQYQREGWLYVHPFDDPLVMAGQGTLGLEILEDLPELTDVIVSIGGGGLMSGVATAIKSLKPAVRIWGVETEGADCMAKALAANQIVHLPSITSVARTLGAPAASERTFACAKRYLESVTVVPDKEALSACQTILERAKILTEPAASCTLAAAQRLRSNFSDENHVALVLCGGNIAVHDLCKFMSAM